MAGSDPSPDFHASFKELLFGDLPLDRWGPDATGTPWSWFAEARAALASGDRDAAARTLARVAFTEGLESRHHLQAWNALRHLGMHPQPKDAKRVLGTVVEMPMGQGFDALACYRDHTARYLNHAGRIVIVESPLPSVTPLIDDVLTESQRVVDAIGPHQGERPPGPPVGQARLSFLTPSGLHFGQTTPEVLFKDALAGPVLVAATRLLQAIIELDTR